MASRCSARCRRRSSTCYAEGDIEAPPAIVRDVLLDYEHASKVTNNVGESRVLAKERARNRRLPAAEAADHLRSRLHAARDLGAARRTLHDAVRGRQFARAGRRATGSCGVSTMQGSWSLEPIRGGAATHARYHVQIDLGRLGAEVDGVGRRGEESAQAVRRRPPRGRGPRAGHAGRRPHQRGAVAIARATSRSRSATRDPRRRARACAACDRSAGGRESSTRCARSA